jgi:hypothetical protein
VTPPETDPVAAELTQGALAGLLGSGTESHLLIRNAGAYDGNALLVISLGFSLRRFESGRGGAAPLSPDFTARLHDARELADEAGVVAEELADPRRHKRLIAARLAAQAAAASGGDPGPDAFEVADPEVDAPHSATEEFLSIFAPGDDVWQALESWARSTGREVARERNRALLDAAGVATNLDLEPIVDRLDTDFLFRFGYALAACDEVLARAER